MQRALAIVFVVSLGLAYTTGPTRAQETPDDHFLCYKAKTTKGAAKLPKGTQATLSDQFEAVVLSDVKRKEGLCNPADKNGEGIVDADTHLTAYQIKAAAGATMHVRRTDITVANQFGEIRLDTIKEDRLLVPAAKSVDGPVTAPDNALHDVDHYKCYKTKVTRGTSKFPKKVQASVDDQFTQQATILDVKKPQLLCNPVDKNGEGIKNGDGHLLCYQVKPAKGEPKHPKLTGVRTADQFIEDRVDTIKEEFLCVPSLKNPPGEFATFNTGLFPEFVPLADERVPAVAAAVANTDASVLCLQEVWRDEDVATIIGAAQNRYPFNYWVPTTDPTAGEPACTAEEVDPLLTCVTDHDCENDPAGLINCGLLNCGDEVTALAAANEVCFSCIAANAALGTIAGISNACLTGGGSLTLAGRNGVVLLSTQPLQNTEIMIFDAYLNQRVVLHAQVERPVVGLVDVFCTHLTAIFDDTIPYGGNFGSWAGENAAQIQSLLDYIDEVGTTGQIVALGDFNTGPEIPPDIVGEVPANYALLAAGGLTSPYADGAGVACTFCNDNTLQVDPTNDKTIDHVFFRGLPGAATFQSRRILTELVSVDTDMGTVQTNISDHYGVAVSVDVE
jgi:endonuclease/exonuclease/phosphatase family metal-dependent hydrolase